MAAIVTRTLCLAALALLPSAADAAVAAPEELAYVAGGEVWVANADGSGARRLTTNASARWAGWSPDGTRVAFMTRVDGEARAELHVVEPDGTGRRRLTMNPVVVPWSAEPAWSPDGAALALVTREALNGPADIRTFAVDGRSRRVTADAREEGFVQWASPDTILYATSDPDAVVRAISVATGTWRLVVRGGYPALSPDRSQLAYVTGGDAPAVHVAALNGPGRRTLPIAGVLPVARPAWSPDGSRLAVVGHVPTGETGRYARDYYSHLWLLDATSGAARRVTGYPGEASSPNFHSHSPVWWPAGERLFVQGDGGSDAPHVVGSDGRCLQRATALPPIATSLSWRPGATPPAPPLRCVDLWTRASVAATEVARGQPVRVTVTVRNVGNVAAPAARLVLSPVVGGRVGTVATTHGTCSASGCELGAVAAGMEVRVTLTLVTERPRAVGMSARAVSDGERDVRDWNDGASIAAAVSVCSVVGTWGNDVLLGTRRADYICGRPGADRIDGAAGDDRLEAGSGADTVIGGPGRDSVLGWDGPDVILVRDGQRDTVECGPQRDTVVADRGDRVARDCERVVRR